MAPAKSMLSFMLVVIGVVLLTALPGSIVVATTTYPIEWAANFGALADSVGDSLSQLSSIVDGATLEVGDSLRFEYNNVNNNLLEVTRSAIRACDSSAPLRKWTDGDTSITFPEEGVFFFISGTSDQCLANQRLVVKVTEHTDAKEQHPRHRKMQEEAGMGDKPGKHGLCRKCMCAAAAPNGDDQGIEAANCG